MMCLCTTAAAANTIVADTGAAGSMMLVGMTYETRWISHKLGPIQMGAYSIAHSAKNYVENVRALWGGSTAKIGRAVGADDDAEVSRLIKMTILTSMVCIMLQCAFYIPASPWLLKEVYHCNTTVGNHTRPGAEYPWGDKDEHRSVFYYALPYLQIRAIGESGTRFLEEAAASIIQGTQFLVPYTCLQFFHSGFTWLATWYAVELHGWSIDVDAWTRVLRELLAFLFCYSVLFYITRCKEETRGRWRLLSEPLRSSDWKHFIGDGIFMLITAYSAMVVDTLTGILTARLSTDEASANQILSRVQSFPYVFSGAFGAAINVLGSRYLGESDDARYLNLGFALIATSLLIGGVCAVVIYAAARSIFGIYTDDTAVRYACLPAPATRRHSLRGCCGDMLC
jgi:Na+-driven multidrug efflux pump